MYEDYADAWNRCCVEDVKRFHSDGCIYEDVAYGVKVEGLSDLVKFIEGVFQSIPDFRLEVISFFSTDEFAAAEWVMSGTRGENQFRENGATIMVVKEGKFARNSDYHNLSPA